MRHPQAVGKAAIKPVQRDLIARELRHRPFDRALPDACVAECKHDEHKRQYGANCASADPQSFAKSRVHQKACPNPM